MQALTQSVRLFVEYARFGHTPRETEGLQMLESTVELVGGLFLSALILLVSACILGSIYAALRAVSRESDYQRERVKQGFGVVAEVTVSEDGHCNLPHGSQTLRADASGMILGGHQNEQVLRPAVRWPFGSRFLFLVPRSGFSTSGICDISRAVLNQDASRSGINRGGMPLTPLECELLPTSMGADWVGG